MSEKLTACEVDRLQALAEVCCATILEYTVQPDPPLENFDELTRFAVFSQGQFVGSFMSYKLAYDIAASFGGRLI